MQNSKNVSHLFHSNMLGYNSPKIVKRTDYVRKDGQSAILLQVIIDRKKKCIPLGLFATDKDWDKVSGYYKKSHPHHADLNLIIDSAKAKATDIFLEYRIADKIISVNEFESIYNNYEVRRDFISYMERTINSRRGDLGGGTVDSHMNTLKKLKDFRSSIAFYELDVNLLNDFNIFLKKKKNNMNTRNKEFRNISIYVNLAIEDQGIKMENPFKKFKKPRTTDRIIFLNKDEIKLFYDEFNSSDCDLRHKKYLRVWLLMMCTGLRVGDVVKITKDQILENSIVFVPQKSQKAGKIHSIPLTKMARKFINPEGDYIGLNVSTDAIRSAISDVAKKLGIKKTVNNHLARHTFATQFLLNGGDILTLQKLLCHRDISDTMKYEHITQDYKRERINTVFDLFYADLTKQSN